MMRRYSMKVVSCKPRIEASKPTSRTSLGVQWLRIHLPMQGNGFNPWSGKIPHAEGQVNLAQLPSPCALASVPCNEGSHSKEKPTHNEECL